MPELCSGAAAREKSSAIFRKANKFKRLWQSPKMTVLAGTARIWGEIANLLTISPLWLSRT
jgi:hypothetical protein